MSSDEGGLINFSFLPDETLTRYIAKSVEQVAYWTRQLESQAAELAYRTETR